MVTIKNVNFSTFGNCLEISNGVVVLRVTTDLGPRIIYYGTTDEDNMMHTDDLGLNKRPSEFLDKNYKKAKFGKFTAATDFGSLLRMSPAINPTIIR